MITINIFLQFESFVHILIRFWMKFTCNLLFYLPAHLYLLLDLFLHLMMLSIPCLSNYMRSCISIKRMLHSKSLSLPLLVFSASNAFNGFFIFFSFYFPLVIVNFVFSFLFSNLSDIIYIIGNFSMINSSKSFRY